MDIESMRRGGRPSVPTHHLSQLRAIARQLDQIAGLPEAGDASLPDGAASPPDLPNDDQIAKFAMEELGWRVARNQAFGSAALFGEPTWELLLDLFVNWVRGQEVTVTSACIASGVPITTGLRYMSSLIEAGLIVRQPSAHDRRMHIVHLTRRGRKLVRESLIDRLGLVRASG
jgi:predicted transcriptional regulator